MMPWYTFTPILPSCDPQDPTNYTLLGDLPPQSSESKLFFAAIQADDNCGLPHIDMMLRMEIINALELEIDTINVRLDDRNKCAN
ncbi:hypothetical protein [Sphingobacterium anhuiense]|uniref:Uncharacterized protein n=1 Tax=Sphingobacterium anhuiense TaxID=493780 RepID=A0ABW5YWH4_9SPHI